MISGIKGVAAPTNSAGIVSRQPVERPDQILKKRIKEKQRIQQDKRFDELKNKAKTENLSNSEKVELAYLQALNIAEDLSAHPPVCYVA